MRRLVALLLATLIATAASAGNEALVLRGGTLVDLSDFGRGTRDIPAATVVIRNGRIVAAGPAAKVPIPEHARVLDASGAWIVPGLNDVFATVNNQAQANAFLASAQAGAGAQ